MKLFTIVTITTFLLFVSGKSFAQPNTLEKALSASACNYLNKINLDTVLTQQQKKNVLSQVFAQATRDNEQILKNDKRFIGASTYEQGKKIGLWIGQFVVPIMMNDCPKFLTLMSK